MTTKTIITHDGLPLAVVATDNEAFAWLLRNQGQSVDYATTYGGYATRTVEEWDEETARSESAMARRIIRDPWHLSGHGGDNDKLTRENCASCVLAGYGIDSDEEGPNYAAWPRVYVQSRTAIPAKWRAAFVRELHDDDNKRYSEALWRDVATFSVRYV